MKTQIEVIAEIYRKTASNCIPLVLRLTKDRKRKIIRLGITINVLHWDESKKKIKPVCPNLEYIENIVTETKAKYQKQVLEFQSIGKEYSLQQLSNSKHLLSHSCLISYFSLYLSYNKKIMGFVRLSEEEKSELEKLYKTSSNSVVRNRCLSLLYSNEQRSIKEVSGLVRVSRRSLERLFDSWESAQDK